MNPNAAHEVRHAIAFARANTYTIPGNAWRQFIASLAFETKADLSLIRDFEEHDQARFLTISHAFMVGEIQADEIRDLYLEHFPWPQREVGDWLEDV